MLILLADAWKFSNDRRYVSNPQQKLKIISTDTIDKNRFAVRFDSDSSLEAKTFKRFEVRSITFEVNEIFPRVYIYVSNVSWPQLSYESRIRSQSWASRAPRNTLDRLMHFPAPIDSPYPHEYPYLVIDLIEKRTD